MAWSKMMVEKMMGQTLPVDLGLENLEDVFDDATIALPEPGVVEEGQLHSLSTSNEGFSW